MPELVMQPTSSGLLIPSLGGKFFCSSRDQLKEAQVWFQRQGAFLQDSSELVILGLGAGFHLQEILHSELCPSRVVVVEVRRELVDRWCQENRGQVALGSERVQFPIITSSLPENLFLGSLLLEFRPAWVGNEEFYQNLAEQIRGPTIKEVVSHLSIQDQSKEAKVWRCLQELVR